MIRESISKYQSKYKPLAVMANTVIKTTETIIEYINKEPNVFKAALK